MPVFRWGNPLHTFQELEREMDRWVRLAFEGLRAGQPFPPLNLYETEDAYVITAELPGYEEADFEINVATGELTLKGARSTADVPEERFRRSERLAGQWERTISLPQRVDESSIRAELTKSGLLRVLLPKLPATEARKIKVVDSKPVIPLNGENPR